MPRGFDKSCKLIRRNRTRSRSTSSFSSRSLPTSTYSLVEKNHQQRRTKQRPNCQAQ